MKAQQGEIIEELLALSQHYMRVIRSPEQEERFLRDYLEDLASYPIASIRAGCKAWRHSDAIKFPTPGQLVAKVRAQLPSDARRMGAAAETWKWPDEPTYERMSLAEKIRSRLIMASLCREKAGPMWRGKPGEGGGPTERPPERQRWIEKAENHAAEAARLQKMLRQAENVA